MAIRRILLLLAFASVWPLLLQAQQRKPCGTSVLQHRRAMLRSQSTSPLTRSAPSSPVVYEGEKRGLVILVSFPNQSFSEADPKAAWTARICEEGHSENGSPGSVSDYFRDQSYGRFQIHFDVMGPVEMSQPYEYYGKDIYWEFFDDTFDRADGEMVEEACRAVADSVHFADYDWNGDGMVEQVFLLYAGHGESDYWQKDKNVIWPHMGQLTVDWFYPEPLRLQGVDIDVYACGNEINLFGDISGIGTMCHEFSHGLGLRDLYNTQSGASVIGDYDLMDSGNNNRNGWCPPGYSSYERYACGWLNPQPIDDPKTFVDSGEAALLKPLHLEPDVRIYQPADTSAYYLIERREKDSWDASLPRDGVQAWYVDYDEVAWKNNVVNGDFQHYRVMRLSLDKIPSSIASPVGEAAPQPVAVYDLYGRRYPLSVLQAPHASLLIVRYSDGTVQKR